MSALPSDAVQTLAHAWLEPARPTDAADLSSLTQRSKAHWGYSAAQMTAWAEELTITPAYLEAYAVYLVRRPAHWPAAEIPPLLGYYAYAPTREDTVLLDNLFVDPLAMQYGLGRRLLHDFILATRQAAYRRARVVSDPNAVGFYRHFGFRPLAGEAGWQASGPNRKLPVLERPLMPVPGSLDGERVQLVPAVPADMRRMHEWLANAMDHMGLAESSSERNALSVWPDFREAAAPACHADPSLPACRAYVLEHEHAPVGQISYFTLKDDADQKELPDTLPTALLHAWMADLRLTRRGYGTDAIRTLCAYLHQELGFRRFVLAFPKSQQSAQRMAYNLGFRKEVVALPAELSLPDACTMTACWPLTSF